MSKIELKSFMYKFASVAEHIIYRSYLADWCQGLLNLKFSASLFLLYACAACRLFFPTSRLEIGFLSPAYVNTFIIPSSNLIYMGGCLCVSLWKRPSKYHPFLLAGYTPRSKKRACTKMLLPLMLHYPIVCTSTSHNLLRTHLCLWYCRIPTFGRCTAALQYTCLALSMSPTQHYGTTSPRMPRLPSAPVRILVWSFDYQTHPLSPSSLTASTSQEKIP